MDIKTRLTRCCGRESEYGQICRDGYRCPDCFDKLEGWREIERLREALEARPSNEELKLAEKHCDWNAFKHAFGAVMKHRRSAIQQKESE